ncbi:MAG: hypothetical protein MJZ72_09420 [Bacteroidales bacterium]|nr:hypothetical protein [Bacteroidales bacterium]
MVERHILSAFDDFFGEYISAVIQLSLKDTPLVINSASDKGSLIFSLELPGKVRCSVRVISNELAQDRTLSSIESFKNFILEDYSEARMMTVDSALRFLELPGRIEFLDEEENYQMMYRIAIIAAQEIFGQRNIYGAEFISEKSLIFHTREGQFRVRVDDFKYNLRDTIETMKHYMRKPIRKRYDKECNEKRLKQE